MNVASRITGQIIAAAIEVHSVLGGPGLLEGVYEKALVRELRQRGLHVDTQVPVPIVYKGHRIDPPLRLDVLVEEQVIVEVKATEHPHPVHRAQALTYLRLSRLRLGLVLNFGFPTLKDGIQRVVNRLPEPRRSPSL